jgi:hypothetical protein
MTCPLESGAEPPSAPSADSAPHVVNKMCDEVLQCHELKFQASVRAVSRGYVSDLT